MVDIQSTAAEIRRGKRRKKKIERNYRMKILSEPEKNVAVYF